MRSRSKGHAAVGGTSTFGGAALAVAGVARPGFTQGAFLDAPVWMLLLTAGFALLLVGACILLFSFRPAPEEPDVVPAYVAFNSRMSIPPMEPPLRARPTAASAAPARAASRLASPPPPQQQRVAPNRGDLEGLDAQIRELSKRINKAGVMLATGQLSQEGYAAYVDDLKRQRGNLEAARVRAELRS